ncbi:hypothetical protein IFM89_011370 [Coptis chinensis]|uniref:Uncharacterized protein n=1 Tax=Coptis chinensis TaxID=261450 RepID=A0A835LRE4_9MAGN|nr:hypothetical protein IFM89_011370 [Coptis chinensis]
MVMEIFLDPNNDIGKEDPIIVTSYNVTKAVKDSILLNFGECGLATTMGSFSVTYVNPITKLCIMRVSRETFQNVWAAITMVRIIGNCPVTFNLLDSTGSLKVLKSTALKCDEAKFEQYKQLVGDDKLTAETTQKMQNSLEKIKFLN